MAAEIDASPRDSVVVKTDLESRSAHIASAWSMNGNANFLGVAEKAETNGFPTDRARAYPN